MWEVSMGGSHITPPLRVVGGVGISEGVVVGVAEAAGFDVVCPLSSSLNM
jgi:hypothetical protein